MKLCIVTHKVVKGDGQGRVNYEVAAQALRDGHEVTFLTTELAEEMRSRPNAAWARIPVSSLPMHLIRNQIFALRTALWLRRHRREFDIVHVNGFITWAAGDVNASHFVHSKWLQSYARDPRLKQGLLGKYQWFYTLQGAWLERWAYRRARLVVSVSERVKQELTAIGIPGERIRVIHNGVDLDEFHPGSVERAKLGLPEDVPLAIFVGDIQTPRKNLDTVLKALTTAADIHLAVAGRVEGSRYPAMAREMGLADRVHFLDFRRDLPELMRAADLMVCPAHYEPFSLVVLEALASGLPVIASSALGAAEVMNAECGIVIADPDDAQMLAEALCSLAHDPPKLAAMRREARAVAMRHSWQGMAEKYLQVYAEIAAS